MRGDLGHVRVAMKELRPTVSYSGELLPAKWRGLKVAEPQAFTSYLRKVVRARIEDQAGNFENTLRGLATTGMATEHVARLLAAVPHPEGWEIGEALAECTLRDDPERAAHWPWNTVRDRRTPRASLPGADLVGFCRREDGILLLFGEVKTSSSRSTPPDVMYGGSGMTWQLEENATRLDIQRTLLAWLHARCQTDSHKEMFQKAVGRYLKSKGKDILLVGVLVRDTDPNELDLKSRAEHLSTRFDLPTRVELQAWYLPVPIKDWPTLLDEEAT